MILYFSCTMSCNLSTHIYKTIRLKLLKDTGLSWIISKCWYWSSIPSMLLYWDEAVNSYNLVAYIDSEINNNTYTIKTTTSESIVTENNNVRTPVCCKYNSAHSTQSCHAGTNYKILPLRWNFIVQYHLDWNSYPSSGINLVYYEPLG